MNTSTEVTLGNHHVGEGLFVVSETEKLQRKERIEEKRVNTINTFFYQNTKVQRSAFY